MSDPVFKYCPRCSDALIERNIGGVQRPACPACGFILFLDPKVVAVVVVRHAGKFLLGKRNMEPGKGLWSFVGGHVDQGEKVEDAALREVKEETNLDVQLEGLIGVYSTRGTSHILIAYHASINPDQISMLSPQHEEISELAFFAWEELPSLAFAYDQQILQDWKKLNS